MKLNGSEILMECLLEHGVDTVFGYPGGMVLNIYDALYKYRDKIRHILPSHEQGASHAADGYSRATGKVGVCIATSGPGATNLVTGIATAYMDSVPVVFITGNVPLNLFGKDSFQEIDITGVSMPITKHNFIVKDIKDLHDIIRRAFYIAKEGRPGPVLVDIPKDITAMVYDYEKKEPLQVKTITDTIRAKDIKEAVEIIKMSKKPLIYYGGGVIISSAEKELQEFAEKIDAPVCTSLMGIGGFPGADKRFIGMIGMHGTKTSSLCVTNCDLLIAIGARFSDRVVGNVNKFAKNATILHIDIDPAEVGKNVKTYNSVIGDVKEVLIRLNSELDNVTHTEWMEETYAWKEQFPLKYSENSDLKGQYIIERLYELTKNEDVLISTEVGQHQIWTAQFYKFDKPRTLLTSGGLGTMGYGLGASIGASIATGKKTINVAGDGCFRMNCNELATAVEYNVPIVVLILNNHVLGMVRQWQNLFYDGRYSYTNIDRATDFVKLAEAYNAVGLSITKPEEVDEVLLKALKETRPVVINCEIGRDLKVYPMVPPGAAIEDIMLEDEVIN